MTPSHVLVALDGSPLADDALEYALAVFDCPVTVLNVVTPLDTSMSESGVLADDRDREARERAERVATAAKRRVSGEQRRVETVVETGEPAETILTYVETHDIDQVVLGSHGGDRHELARRLLGTVAERVVGEAPVPVTVVR